MFLHQLVVVEVERPPLGPKHQQHQVVGELHQSILRGQEEVVEVEGVVLKWMQRMCLIPKTSTDHEIPYYPSLPSLRY